MQVLLMLTSDLDGANEKDKAALDDLLTAVVKEVMFKLDQDQQSSSASDQPLFWIRSLT